MITYFGKPKRKNTNSNLIDLIIATILSQNTNDNLSGIAFANLKKSFETWDELLKSPIRKIESKIKIGGLSKQKSKWIKAFLVNLQKSRGELDLSYLNKLSNEEILSELIQNKGIGVKTIACLLLFGLKRDILPVDTHVHRILNRIGIVETKNPKETFFEMQSIVLDGSSYDFHINLIRLGRNICKSRKPNCLICPVFDCCEYKSKNLKKVGIKSEGYLLEDYFILNSI